MKKTALTILLCFGGTIAAEEFSRHLNDCRALVAEVRPTGDEGEKGQRYFEEAEGAYRNCQDAKLPLDLRVNALLKYAIATDNLGRKQQAIAVLKDAIALLDHSRGNDASLLIEVLEQASSAETLAGLPTDAISHAKRALALRQEKFGRQSAETAEGMVNVAMVYATFDETAKGEALVRDAIRIATKACGPECEALVSAYSAMQVLYEAQGNQTEAQKYGALAQEAVPNSRGRSTKQ